MLCKYEYFIGILNVGFLLLLPFNSFIDKLCLVMTIAIQQTQFALHEHQFNDNNTK